MFHYNGPGVVRNTVPIHSFNKGRPVIGSDLGPTYYSKWWAYMIDDGSIVGESGTYGRGFQRSRLSPTQLVENQDGLLVPATPPIKMRSKN